MKTWDNVTELGTQLVCVTISEHFEIKIPTNIYIAHSLHSDGKKSAGCFVCRDSLMKRK